MSATKKLRDLKLPLPAGDLGNRHGYQAPVHKTKEVAKVRGVVAHWAGRTLRVQWALIIEQMRAIDLKAYDFYAATNPLLYPDD